MAALVQSYSQQSATVTMLQGRPAPSPGIMPVGQSSPNHPYPGPSNQAPRSAYNGPGAVAAAYRGNIGSPVQPYAFSTAQNATQSLQWQQQHQHQHQQQHQQQQQRPAYRANPSSALPAAQSVDPAVAHRSHRQNASVTNMALLSSYAATQSALRDDLTASQSRSALQSRQSHSSAASQPSSSMAPQSSRRDLDRHKRSSLYGAQPVRHPNPSQPPPSHASKSAQSHHALSGSRSVPNLSAYSQATADPSAHRRPAPDDVNKMRRRSVHSIDAADPSRPALKPGPSDSPRADSSTNPRHGDKNDKTPRIVPLPPKVSSHSRNASSDSVSSSRSTHSRTPSSSNRTGPAYSTNTSSNSSEKSVKSGQPKTSVPPRNSSADGVKRSITPSPLSKPATMASEPRLNSSSPASNTSSSNLNSPAAKQLAAINQKGTGTKPKSKTSRLRRAFSFGSAAELREAASASESSDQSQSSTKSSKAAAPEQPQPPQPLDTEQARIAEAQEAGGIGTSIYGGRVFGSTDNLSISSTASSASVMIRKMGRGVKSRTRSLVGLFRPKSGTGAAAADSSAPETSEPAVSMVHVEAEAQRVNVTPDPRTARAGKGGIGFPHLERNSLDASQVPDLGSDRLGSSGTENSGSRKSIMGGDRERAEVLAAVRKGILKRATSPCVRPIDSPDLVPPSVPTISDSPNSSAPSTPVDDAQGPRRAGSIAIGHEDYFMSALRLRQDSRSRPETPQAIKRNATFSPRIVFHDTWPSQEYDRRGEIATCNRLTPMLAQQIKEELNSFKMEMEVHENSKIYTHFF